jgi:SAM-dependent methyltransferase
MKFLIRSLLNNALVNRFFILFGLDYKTSQFRNHWANTVIDPNKSLQINMGFSERPEIELALARVHNTIRKVYDRNCAGGAVLDVGCGVGLYLSDFPDGIDCHGIDVSEDFINVARQRLPKAHLRHGDYLDMDFEQQFTLIYSISVLQYIPPSRLSTLVDKVKSNLVPGGILLVQYPHALSPMDCTYPDLAYIQYSPIFIEKIFSPHFEIVSHTHCFDGRNLKFDYDDIRYDLEMSRSFRNGAILVCKKP